MFTKETKIIIGKERAAKFAKLFCEKEDLERVLGKINGEGYHHPERKQIECLVVPGYSEIVEVFDFCLYDNSEERSLGRADKDYWSTDTSTYALQIIATGELLRVWSPENSCKRFGFSLYERQLGPCRDFEFEEERPQYVGAATQKKIEAWLGYLHRERQAQVNYMATARVRNAELRAAVLRKFPNAKMREKDGWMIECWFSDGVLDYHITTNEDGGFSRSYTVNDHKVPSYKEQLGIE